MSEANITARRGDRTATRPGNGGLAKNHRTPRYHRSMRVFQWIALALSALVVLFLRVEYHPLGWGGYWSVYGRVFW